MFTFFDSDSNDYDVFRRLVFSGAATVVAGYVGSAFAAGILGVPSLPDVCKSWNTNHLMEWSLFFTGVILEYARFARLVV